MKRFIALICAIELVRIIDFEVKKNGLAPWLAYSFEFFILVLVGAAAVQDAINFKNSMTSVSSTNNTIRKSTATDETGAENIEVSQSITQVETPVKTE